MKKWKRLRHERDRSNVRSEEFAVLGALGVRRLGTAIHTWRRLTIA